MSVYTYSNVCVSMYSRERVKKGGGQGANGRLMFRVLRPLWVHMGNRDVSSGAQPLRVFLFNFVYGPFFLTDPISGLFISMRFNVRPHHFPHSLADLMLLFISMEFNDRPPVKKVTCVLDSQYLHPFPHPLTDLMLPSECHVIGIRKHLSGIP